MAKRISKIAASIWQLGDIEVNDWDFAALINKDIKEIEIGRSLRKLGSRRVTEWEFSAVVPALQKLARQEVDLAGWVKRTANRKVLEWDFRGARAGAVDAGARVSPEEALIERLRKFLVFLAANLLDGPGVAEVRGEQIERGVLRLRVVVAQNDLKGMLGRHGETAAAMRRILKGSAEAEGLYVLLEILSVDEDRARRPRKNGGR